MPCFERQESNYKNFAVFVKRERKRERKIDQKKLSRISLAINQRREEVRLILNEMLNRNRLKGANKGLPSAGGGAGAASAGGAAGAASAGAAGGAASAGGGAPSAGGGAGVPSAGGGGAGAPSAAGAAAAGAPSQIHTNSLQSLRTSNSRPFD